MKLFRLIFDKYQKKEILKYLFWKLGLQKLFRMQIFTHPIKYLKYLYFRTRLSSRTTFDEVFLNTKFNLLKNKKSDIFLHLDTLYKYASESESVMETGVRGVVSSWAFLKGLKDSDNENCKFFLNDIEECNIFELEKVAQNVNVDLTYSWQNNLDLEIDTNFDIVFIDTLHVYGQLRKELNKFSKITNKYLIMHDTTVDGIQGEILRRNLNIHKYSTQMGIPVDELSKGLWPAVEEFLSKNQNWILHRKYDYNNGLTILKKIH